MQIKSRIIADGADADSFEGIVAGQAHGDLIGGPAKLASLLLETVHTRGQFDHRAVLTRYLDWWTADGFDTGPIAADVFHLAARGIDIETAVRQVDAAHGGMTAGCAPMHRNVVLASVPFIADVDLDECVRQEARLTHRHPLASDAAVVAARTARQLARGVGWDGALATAVAGLSGPVAAAIDGWQVPPVHRIGYSPAVLHAVLHFVGTSKSFGQVLDRLMAFSGDENYLPVLAGALAGARWGYPD